jgi:putative membrane protein
VTEEKSGFQPRNIAFGLMMGAADIVPGVSGGTVALVVGIYERLIRSIRAAATFATMLLRGRVAEARTNFASIEWGFLIPLGIGILTALFVGARVLAPLLEIYPVRFRALFFGLIAGSLAIPWKRRTTHSGRHYAAAVIAATVAFLLVGVPPRELVNPPLILVFLAASIAICAMILPGVSGAYLLLVMGMYGPTLAAAHPLNLTYIAVFGLGAIVGLGAFSKLLSFLLLSYHDITMATLVGLMAGSLRALWPYQDESRALLGPPSGIDLAIVAAIAIAGFTFVVVLTRFGNALEEPRKGIVRQR